MAFNPFHAFRKHQKAFFAGLAIMCMFTFFLCTGISQGDFGSWLLGLFSRRGGGEAAKINGKAVTNADIINLRNQRGIANSFMSMATQQARANRLKSILSRVDAKVKKELDNPFLSMMASFNKAEFRKQLQTLMLKNPSAAKAIQRFQRASEEDAELMMALQMGSPYFDGGDTEDDLLEFILWRNEADRLGVQLVDAGVREEVKKATHDYLTDKDWQGIEDNLRMGNRDVTLKLIMDALRDEFRVRLVQAAELGYRTGAGSRPSAAVTPEQYWQFYKEKRSEMNVAFLPIPVEAFMDKVEGKPTKEELKRLFEKGKNRQKDPALPQPAFRQPPRVQIGWITQDPNSPDFRQTKTYRKIKRLSKFYQLLSCFNATPASPEAALLALDDLTKLGETPQSINKKGKKAKASEDKKEKKDDQPAKVAWRAPLGLDYRLYIEYDQQKERGENKLPSWTEPNFVLPYYLGKPEKEDDKLSKTQARKRSERAAALLGLTVGTGLTAGNTCLATVPFVYQAPMVARQTKKEAALAQEEIDRRAAVTATILLAGAPTLPGPQTAPFFQAGLVYYAGNQRSYMPMEAIKERLAETINEEAARKQIYADMRKLKKKIEEFHPAEKEDVEGVRKPKVERMLKDAKKEYGLQIHQMKKPEDVFQIQKDPELAPLKKATGSSDEEFGKLFFDPTEIYIPKPLGQTLEQGERDMTPTQQPFIYWKVATKEARVPQSFDENKEVRSQVENRWRFQKAQVLARKKAEAIMKALKKATSDKERYSMLRDYEDQLNQTHGEEFRQALVEEDGIAPRKLQLTPRADQRPAYTDYAIPKDKFKYPKEKTWTRKVLEMEKPDKTVQLLENEPGSFFVIAVRTKEPKASQFGFVNAYRQYNRGENEMQPDPLWVECQQKYAQEFRTRVIKQLKEKQSFDDLRTEQEKAKAKERGQDRGRPRRLR